MSALTHDTAFRPFEGRIDAPYGNLMAKAGLQTQAAVHKMHILCQRDLAINPLAHPERGGTDLTVLREKSGRSERIRTSGPCVPNTVLYQAELHSDDRERAIPLSGPLSKR